MTRAKRPVGLTLAGLALVLISVGTQAEVVLFGPAAGRPNEVVEFSLSITPGTISSIDIIPRYDKFSKILTLLSYEFTPALMDGSSGPCVDGACALFYASPKSFDTITELASWQYMVNADAENFVTANGEFKPFTFEVTVERDRVLLPADRTFRVLAVPEPSTWVLVAIGFILILATGARASRSDAATQRRTV